MFTESAQWYDRFYGQKDYAGEARRITDLIRAHRPVARTLLDVACGTGRHLEHLCATFACAGTDLDGDLLAIARDRLPDVEFTPADMTDFDLGRRFDAVTCLFSAIGYMGTVEALRAAMRAAGHLVPGGILVVEPWLTPETWQDGRRGHAMVVEEDGATYVRVVASKRTGTWTEVSMHYAVARDGRITAKDELHRLRLFTPEEYLDAARAAGLDPRWDGAGLTGRGLLLAGAPGGT